VGGWFSEQGSTHCSICGAGKISAAQASSCESCPPGRFSSGDQQTSCSLCRSGKYAPTAGASACLNCAAGKTSGTGALECVSCDANKFSSEGSTGGCQICGGGSIPSSDQSSCEPCAPGFRAQAGDVNCTACGAGSFSTRGSSVCTLCDAGNKCGDGNNMTLCPVGEFSGSGASTCTPCPENTFNDVRGATSCQFCPTNMVSHVGAISCTCADGFDRHPSTDECLCGGGSTLVGSACLPCEKSKFKESFGVESCKSCDVVVKNSVTLRIGAANRSLCICPNDKYLDRQHEQCHDLLEGMYYNTSAAAGGLTVTTVELENGYWRTHPFSEDIRECPVAAACIGGLGNFETRAYEHYASASSAADSKAYCRDGHHGPYCSLCDDNFSHDVFGICEACKAMDPTGTLGSILLLIILPYLMYFLYCKVFDAETRESFSESIKNCVKILFVTLQILVTLPSVVPQISLPESFLDFIKSLSVFKLDIFQIFKVGCISGSVNFHDFLLTATLTPLVLVGCMCLLTTVNVIGKQFCFTVALAILSIVLPTVCTVVFSTFPCDEFDNGDEFLRADYSIECASTEHKVFYFYGILMVCIYPIGVPTLFAHILYSKRTLIKTVDDDNVEKDELEQEKLQQVSFLYDAYVPKVSLGSARLR